MKVNVIVRLEFELAYCNVEFITFVTSPRGRLYCLFIDITNIFINIFFFLAAPGHALLWLSFFK